MARPDDIAAWIAREVAGAGMKGAVLGLSGGVDSAVAAALCRKALGDRVLGVVMACESSPRDEEDALLVARALGLKTATVRLEDSYRALLTALPEGDALARANLKPRLRMTVLYHFAKLFSYLVVGAGNKTEIMVGYFTKHGDSGADLVPLGAIYKTEVRELARELGIPQGIIAKPPSAGLWAGQTDEAELGISYDELDRALFALEAGQAEGVPTETLERVRQMVGRSAHKRRLPPVFEAG